MIKKMAVVGVAGLCTAAMCVARGRTDVAAAVTRIASATALAQPMSREDIRLVREFARGELGELGRRLNHVLATHASVAATLMRNWMDEGPLG
jgi:hypothetical protein